MTLALSLPILALAAVLQSSVVSHLQVFGGSPDLVLLCVLAWNLVGHESEGLLWALAGGLFADALSAGPMGAMTFGLLVVGYLAGLGEGRLWRTHVLLPLAAALVGTLVYHLILMTILSLTGHPVAWGDDLALITFPSVILNALLILPVYRLARWLDEALRPELVRL